MCPPEVGHKRLVCVQLLGGTSRITLGAHMSLIYATKGIIMCTKVCVLQVRCFCRNTRKRISKKHRMRRIRQPHAPARRSVQLSQRAVLPAAGVIFISDNVYSGLFPLPLYTAALLQVASIRALCVHWLQHFTTVHDSFAPSQSRF